MYHNPSKPHGTAKHVILQRLLLPNNWNQCIISIVRGIHRWDVPHKWLTGFAVIIILRLVGIFKVILILFRYSCQFVWGAVPSKIGFYSSPSMFSYISTNKNIEYSLDANFFWFILLPVGIQYYVPLLVIGNYIKTSISLPLVSTNCNRIHVGLFRLV